MIYTAPSGVSINTVYIEVVSPIEQTDNTTQENYDPNLVPPITYNFIIRTMSGFLVHFTEEQEDRAISIRNEIIDLMSV